MKKQDFTFSRKRYYLLLSLVGLLMLLYLGQAIRPLLALAYHQKFSGIPAEQYRAATQTLETAIRLDRKNPQYHQELGRYLHQFYAGQPSLDAPQRKMGFQEAAASLTTAAILNPGNPWNYYELGRLENYQYGCASQDDEECLTQQYFLSALKKSPGNIFLQGTVSGWLYQHDPARAVQLIQQFLSRYPESTSLLFDVLWHQISDDKVLRSLLPDNPTAILKFSEFLYAHHLDHESEREIQGLTPPTHQHDCDSADILQRVSDNRTVELGRDDGSAEWRSYLASEETRIKKSICLPEDMADYDEAVLKILMNSGVPGEFIASFSLNEHLIQRLERSIPYEVSWHEIPFDISLLYGKKKIHFYVRVTNASASGNYLQIMGDRDTPTSQSAFNFGNTEDLSLDEGIQQGEYMIRLVLKKH
ncbi:MAG: hypothetical protein GY801_02045 [bacterium]|nr:hypothetical protein [bacterium]